MIERHNPPESIGDCFRCCVASILELPAEAVPHWMAADWDKEEDFTWYANMQAWLAERDMAYFEMGPIPNEIHGPEWFKHIAAGGFDAYHTLSGVSPRGFRHTVVARNGTIVHDPHPDRSGLSGPGDDGWMYGFFILRGFRGVDRTGAKA